MRDHSYSIPELMFGLALSMRVGAIPLSITKVNPYARSDAVGFNATAAMMAENLRMGHSPFATPSRISYEIWGFFLMPFHLLPGPSTVYAHIFVALLGSIAVYQVAVITEEIHTPQAGVAAALPLAIYPSVVLTHGALLREAAILCCLTTAARTAIAPSAHSPKRRRVALAVLALAIATVLRTENILLYALAVIAGTTIWYLSPTRREWLKLGVVGILGVIIALPYIRHGLFFLNNLRSSRAWGRTAYLGDATFTTLPAAIGFSWIGVAYFLFAPFPWMIETIADVVVAVEGVINIALVTGGIFGFVKIRERCSPAVIGIVIAVIAGLVLYGFATANVGAAVRHRPMFLWVICIFSGVAVASKIESWTSYSRFDPTIEGREGRSHDSKSAERITSPMQEFTSFEAGIGFVVLLVGILLAYVIPALI